MKLALLTTIACNMAVAYAAEDRVGVRGFLDQLFGGKKCLWVLRFLFIVRVSLNLNNPRRC